MQPAGLRLEQAPPIAVPFRFFLTAPAFLLAAAALLAWSGAEAFDARGTPAALAITHLITLGYMAMVMLGAMLQILPVLAGAPVPGARWVARASHLLLVVGAAALAGGFAFAAPALTKLAAWTLGAGFVVFLAAVTTALTRAAVRSATVIGVTLAAVSLAITVVLGLSLAAMHGWGVAPPNFAIRELHPAWGLAGWTGLLVAGVAYQVVPMFQMTPPYPPAMTRWFPAAVFLVLVAWSVAAWHGEVPTLAATLVVLLAGGYIAFALTTLVLQTRRRRRVPDATLAFWQLGMTSIALAAAVWCVRAVRPDAPETLDLLIGCLAIGGGAVSVIAGMLYKIVPFLGWFHLQASVGPKGAPHMKKFLGDSPQQLHVRVHAVAVAFLAIAALWPPLFVYPAAAALGASALVQLRNLALAARFYRAELARAPVGEAPIKDFRQT